MLGAVRMRNVHLLVTAWVKTAYAACGWNLAISDRRLISETQQLILSWMKCSMKDFDPKGGTKVSMSLDGDVDSRATEVFFLLQVNAWA